jgi:hypothetical protein
MLANQYELFKMFTRMTTITNSLGELGRTYTNAKIMSKTLKSLLKTWEAKMTTTREVKYLIKPPLKDLIGFLMSNEITMEKQEQEKKPKKYFAFKIVHHIENDNDDDDDDDTEEDITLITKQLRSTFFLSSFRCLTIPY